MATDTRRTGRPPALPSGGRESEPAEREGGPGSDDQRCRLLTAVVEIVARVGYSEAKVGEVAKLAGVSRATVYELFETKEGCLLAAQRELADRVTDLLELAVVQGDPARAAQSALGALVAFADREPLGFDFLMHQAMLAGPTAMAERDRLMVRLANTIDRSWAHTPAGSPLLDMSANLLLEGSVRLIGLRTRRDGDAPMSLLADLVTWLDSYVVVGDIARWRALSPNQSPAGAHPGPLAAPSGARAMRRGTQRVAAAAVKRVQRERIAYATAEAIHEKGYANITVADVVAAAGVSRDVFYAHFHDKHEAFEAAIQLLFENLLATLGGAFFGSSGTWPEQVWETGRAFVQFLEDDPILADFLSVATYAPPRYMARVHDFVLAFAVFVEHGNRYGCDAGQVPRIISEAIVCSVLEAVTFQVRHNRVADLWRLIPVVTYMVFVPFMGTASARAFVEAKVRTARVETDARAGL